MESQLRVSAVRQSQVEEARACVELLLLGWPWVALFEDAALVDRSAQQEC